MTPDQRVEMEARVDRAVRRGDLSQAREDLVVLLESFPDDARLRDRLEAFESTALPGELRPSRPATPSEAPSEAPEVLAERLVQEGDLPGALAAYRQAVTHHPENELFRERLAELFEQVRMGGDADAEPPSSSVGSEPEAVAVEPAQPITSTPERGASMDLPASEPEPGAATPAPPAAAVDLPQQLASTPERGPLMDVPGVSGASRAEPGATTSASTAAATAPAAPAEHGASPPRDQETSSEAAPLARAPAGPTVRGSGAPDEAPGHDPVARLEQLLERLQSRRRQP